MVVTALRAETVANILAKAGKYNYFDKRPGPCSIVYKDWGSESLIPSAPLTVDMEEPTTNEERVTFLTETYNISDNCAKALLLSEIGLSHSGIASALDVTQSTARKYLRTLEDRIGENVTEPVPKSVRYPTYPGDTPKSDIEYSGDYIDVSDELEDRDVSLNRGCDFEDIPVELINI